MLWYVLLLLREVIPRGIAQVFLLLFKVLAAISPSPSGGVLILCHALVMFFITIIIAQL